MDPSQQGSGLQLSTVAVPDRCRRRRRRTDSARIARSPGTPAAFEQLLAGYYMLDRNYTYDFHNELFCPVDAAACRTIGRPAWRRSQRRGAARTGGRPRAAAARRSSQPTIRSPRCSTTCARTWRSTFERAATLERMSAEFETDRGRPAARHAPLRRRGQGARRPARRSCSTKHGAVLRARRSRPSPETSSRSAARAIEASTPTGSSDSERRAPGDCGFTIASSSPSWWSRS